MLLQHYNIHPWAQGVDKLSLFHDALGMIEPIMIKYDDVQFHNMGWSN